MELSEGIVEMNMIFLSEGNSLEEKGDKISILMKSIQTCSYQKKFLSEFCLRFLSYKHIDAQCPLAEGPQFAAS